MHHARLLPLLVIVLGGCVRRPPDPVDVSTAASPGQVAVVATTRSPASTTPEYLPAGPARGALSQAVRVGNMLYLSGQLGANDSTRALPVNERITAETRRAMENIKANLARFGSSMDRVVKCTVWLVDMSEWSAMNAVYVTYFAPTNRPARSAVGTPALVNNARVEIECMATVG